MMEAVDRADRADFDPWRRHVDKEEADSGLPPSLAARPDKREHPVGPVCIRRPDLLSVDDIVRAIPNGSCTKSREIRPGRSEAHTSELQSLMRISYDVFCLTKKHS